MINDSRILGGAKLAQRDGETRPRRLRQRKKFILLLRSTSVENMNRLLFIGVEVLDRMGGDSFYFENRLTSSCAGEPRSLASISWATSATAVCLLYFPL